MTYLALNIRRRVLIWRKEIKIVVIYATNFFPERYYL